MRFLKKKKANYNVWEIIFVDIKITFTPYKYRKWAQQFLEEKFNITNWEVKTLLYLFPFLFCSYKVIIYPYQNQNKTFCYFVQKTIPGNNPITEEIFLETFQHIKLKNIEVNQLKEIEFYKNSILIFLNKTNPKYYVGFIPNSDKENLEQNNKVFFRFFSQFFSNDIIQKNLKLKNFYYNLDYLPLKLENISKKFLIKNSFFNFKLKTLKNEKLQNFYKKRSKKKTQNILFSNFILKKNVFGLQPFNKIKEEENSINNFFVKKKLKNQITNKKLLQREFDFLFYKKGLRPNLKLIQKTRQKIFFKKRLVNEILNLIIDFTPLKKTEVLIPRNVSGYEYPDFSDKQVYFTQLYSLFTSSKKKIALKIFFPISVPCSLNNLNITKTRDVFFGVNLKKISKNKIEKKKKYKNIKNIIKWENFIPKEFFIKEKRTRLDFKEITESKQLHLFFYKKIKKKVVKIEKTTTAKKKGFYWKNFFKNKKKQEKSNYYFIPFSEYLINETLPDTNFLGEILKKNQTFYYDGFECLQFWESISPHSWLILIHFWAVFFVIQLSIYFYTDYGRDFVHSLLESGEYVNVDFEKVKAQYLYDEFDYSLIKKVKKKFKNIAGIDNMLPELGEIVWFLRNKGRSSNIKNFLPKGILLAGPPGTGKTLLVQGITGEAQVPVIVESGSLLSDPQQEDQDSTGIKKLKQIFDKALQLKPCLIFIDEIDTIGEKRHNIIPIVMGGDELIESMSTNIISDSNSEFIPDSLNLDEKNNPEKDLEYQLFRKESDNQLNRNSSPFQKEMGLKKTRFNLLTQFLIEMDGLKERQGVIVLGATNRPNVLDPALSRPGRFDTIVNLQLPDKKKRADILKFYSKHLKTHKKISWEYLANRTKGLTAADLATAMNQSAIQSILKQTTHTTETIEHGIDLVTSYNQDTDAFNKLKNFYDFFSIKRLSYFQAGKGILQSLLPNHDPIIVLPLRQKKARPVRFYEKSYIENKTRLTLEAELIGLYAGKAAEIITLCGNKAPIFSKQWQSNLGFEELFSATLLANSMVDKSFFYSETILNRKFNQILTNHNHNEIRELEKLEILSIIKNQIEDDIEIEQIAKIFRTIGPQQRGFGLWWQIQVSKQTSEIEFFFADWYRIYLSDPKESILNLEWIPPETFYYTNESLKKLSQKSYPSFNELYQIERDFIFHGLILNSFNKAFSFLEDMREFLDYFADFLICYDTIRENQISFIFKDKKIKEI